MRLRTLPLVLVTAAACRTAPSSTGEPSPAPLPVPGGGAEKSRPLRITVREAVEEALDRNRSVLSAREAIRIADATVVEARAGLLPTLSARGSFLRRDTPPLADAPELGTTFSVGPKDQFSLDVTASFPLFAFGEYYYGWRAAQAARGRSALDAAATESDVADAVTAAAFDFLEARNQIGVAQANVAALEKQVQDAKAIEAAGRMTRDAVLEAEVELARARRTLERIESLVPLRRVILNALLNRPTDAETDVVDDPLRTPPALGDRERAIADAVTLRPEIRAATLDIERTEHEAKSARGAALPEFRGNLGYHTDDNVFSEPDNYGYLSVTVDVPLFQGGANAARIRRAQRETAVARIAREEAIAGVRTEVVSAWRDVEEAWKDIAVTEQSIAKAEESLRIQSEKFKAGRATSREVLDSNALLTTTRFENVRAVYAYNVAIQRLHRARGLDPRTPPLAR